MGLFDEQSYNTGRSWHLDRQQHNKSEDWEKPMDERKQSYAEGGGVDTIKFYEIANILDLDLEYDGDETDLRLHGREKLNWGAEIPAEYEEATNAIDAISYKGKGWEVYATYDVSGFHYWMLQQEEPNYINMTVMFDTNTVDVTEITAIKNAMDMAYSDAYSIAEKYDYVPNSEYKRGGSVDGRSTRAKSTWNRGGAWTRDRNAHNKSEDWEKPMNKRKYAEGGGIELPYYVYNKETNTIEKYFDNEIEAEEFAAKFENADVYRNYDNDDDLIDNDNETIEVEIVQDKAYGKGYYVIRKYDTNNILHDSIEGLSEAYRVADNNGYEVIYAEGYDNDEEYKRGGKVDGRSTRAKDTWNSGASWTRDRNAHNKSEDWEKPLNQRGKSITKSSSSASSKSSSSASSASKGKSKKYMYIPNYMIRGAEVNNSGKTTDIDGANILDGIYVKKGTKYADGGGLDLFVTPKGRNVEYKGKSGGIYKYKWVDMPSEYSKVISGNGQFKNKINPIVADEMIDSMIINYNKFKDEKYADGGGVESLISLGQGKYKYRDFQFRVEDGEINMTSPDFYEGQSIEGETPTLNEIKSIIADYFDFDNRDFPITKAEATMINKNFSTKEQDEIFGMTFAEGGGVPDLDKKMALINLDMIHEYSVKLDNMVTEETELEEWVKMKLTRIEQNVADVKHAVSGGEKFDGGGMIFKKQLLHISKYAKELIDMVQAGSNLMAWQENKLAIAADNIDGIYHYMDYLNHKNMDKFNEYLMRGNDEYKRGGKVPRNVGRDWIFKSKQKWEQDYDRKREYKEYKKEGWLANWFKDGGEVRMYEILDEVEDYSEVNKNDIPKILAQESFEKGLDDDEIQTKINKHLIKLGYNYDSNEYKWKNANYAKGGVPRNVGRDWIFKSKQKWEQDYDRKREYKEYKKEGWLANWFKEGGEANSGYTPMGGVGETKENWNNASYDEKLEWLKTRTELYPEKGDIFDTADVYARTQYHLLPNNVHIAITQSQKFAKGGRVKNYKYVPNYMIESVDVERNGKTTEIDGGNILDGLYVKGKVTFEEGGYVENIPTETLEAMIGRKLNGWNDDKVIFNGIVYKKCFMKPYYKIA